MYRKTVPPLPLPRQDYACIQKPKVKNHVKVFLESRNITGYDSWICEYCGGQVAEARELDVHHISRRGFGGNKNLDKPENLIGLHRTPCHADADANRISEAVLMVRVVGILEHRHHRKGQ